ncbi:DUF7557 family protein [Halorussus marinus]
MEDMTTVSVSADTWKRLNRAKEPGESFDEVLQRIMNEEESP